MRKNMRFEVSNRARTTFQTERGRFQLFICFLNYYEFHCNYSEYKKKASL